MVIYHAECKIKEMKRKIYCCNGISAYCTGCTIQTASLCAIQFIPEIENFDT